MVKMLSFLINTLSYLDNGDETVTDKITGLIWSKDVDDKKLSIDEAIKKANTHNYKRQWERVCISWTSGKCIRDEILLC
jgi:hypothetical protein